MRLIGKVVSRTVTALVWVMAGVGVATAAVFALVKMEVISTLHVTSGSMEPSFSAGDLLISTRIDAVDIKVGDVITAPDPAGRLITHRVVSVDDGITPTSRLVTMKGDANRAQDVSPYLVEEALLMRMVVPNGANVMTFLTTPPVPYLGLFILACFVGYTFLSTPRQRQDIDRAEEPVSAA